MAEQSTHVPDGDPCPKHGLPTRLLYLPGWGLYSQCGDLFTGCIAEFFDWYAGHTRHVQRAAPAPPQPPEPPPPPAQGSLF